MKSDVISWYQRGVLIRFSCFGLNDVNKVHQRGNDDTNPTGTVSH